MTETLLHPLTAILERSLWYGSLKELAAVAELEDRFRPLDDLPEVSVVCHSTHA